MTTNIGEDVETAEHRLVGVKSNTTIIEIILKVLQNIFLKNNIIVWTSYTTAGSTHQE